MKMNRVGGIIAADKQPLLQVGAIPIVRQIVISYQRAGVFPIVVVTGAVETEVRHALAGLGVIFLANEDAVELMDYVRVGLQFLSGRCSKVVFTPVNVPMFTCDTLAKLIASPEKIVIPSYHGKGGHPVLIDQSVISEILQYTGDDGLRGALQSCDAKRTWLDVDDKGILVNINNMEELEQQHEIFQDACLYPTVCVKLEREISFFTPRLKLLLYLVSETENMRISCTYSFISHSKAWGMINTLEQNVGFQVVERKRGGNCRGSTRLTERGKKLLLAYMDFEEHIQQIAQDEFYNRFICTKILD